MSDSPLVRDLRAAAPSLLVVDERDKMLARSHDMWPLAVKWNQQGHHPHPADVVVEVRHADEVAAVLAVAARHRVPVTPWGRGSSVTGAPLPVRGGIVLDLAGLDGPEHLDEMNLTVTVPAGTLGATLEGRLNARGYTLGHSPQSLDRSTVGGWLATLASGQFSSRYGNIEDLVVGYTVVLADGSSVSLSAAPRAALGPDLRRLFLGSEGTLGVITQATLKVFPVPEHRLVEAFTLDRVDTGVTVMRQIMRAGLRPFLVRFYDEAESRHVVPDVEPGRCVLFLGHEGSRLVAEAEHRVATGLVAQAGARSLGAAPVQAWLARRFDFSAVQAALDRPGGYAETIEVAQAWSGITDLYQDLKKKLTPLADEVLAHFSHVYPQGTSLYLIMFGRASDDNAAQSRLEDIWETAMTVCLDQGAMLSHHHGCGLARQPYLARAQGQAHGLLRRLKGAIDPAGLLNPGKLGLDDPPDPRCQ